MKRCLPSRVDSDSRVAHSFLYISGVSASEKASVSASASAREDAREDARTLARDLIEATTANEAG